MDAAEFRERQKALGLSNLELAEKLAKCSQTVSNYRSGSQGIPPHVEKLLDAIAPAHGNGQQDTRPR